MVLRAWTLDMKGLSLSPSSTMSLLGVPNWVSVSSPIIWITVSNYSIGLLWRLNEIVHIKCVSQIVVDSKYSINISYYYSYYYREEWQIHGYLKVLHIPFSLAFLYKTCGKTKTLIFPDCPSSGVGRIRSSQVKHGKWRGSLGSEETWWWGKWMSVFPVGQAGGLAADSSAAALFPEGMHSDAAPSCSGGN